MEISKLHSLFLGSNGITTDTRKIQTRQLFFALNGENFNGNKFASQAIKEGAEFAVIDEKEYRENEQYILVDNVLETLQQLANYHRKFLKIPILAITGSNGKTTTKELINVVLRTKFQTVATVGNLNNHIGVPLTLLSMNHSTEFGIVEMGANHPGEIDNLCTIAEPDFGYITNFGKAHLEGFGSIEGVIKAKGELYSWLQDHQKLIFLNFDDPVQRKYKDYSQIFSFGSSDDAEVTVKYYNESSTAKISLEEDLYPSSLIGTYNAVNIAAAVSIGRFFEIDSNSIKEAIASYSSQNNRSQVVQLERATIIMDAYNANPTSMKAALESFEILPSAKKIVILGDMFELGGSATAEHQQIVNLLGNLRLDKIFLVGENFSRTTSVAAHIFKFPSFEILKECLLNLDINDSYILVKGSRGMALERVLHILQKNKETGV